ncbi:predicted protein, partial [Nematostella vectensis]
REEGELFGDDEDNDPLARQRYFEEYTDPYDILKLILNYVDSDAGTCLHLATKMGLADGVRSLTDLTPCLSIDGLADGVRSLTDLTPCLSIDGLADGVRSLTDLTPCLSIDGLADGVRSLTDLTPCLSIDGLADGVRSLTDLTPCLSIDGLADGVRSLTDLTPCLSIDGLADGIGFADGVRSLTDLTSYMSSHRWGLQMVPLEGKSALDLASTDELETILASSTKVKAKPLQNGEIHEPSDVDSSDSVETISQLPSPPPVTIKQLSAKTNSATFIDPKFFHLWPSPQRIQEISGTRFFPSSTVPVYIERPKGFENIFGKENKQNDDENLSELTGIWETLGEKFKQAGHSLDIKIITESYRIYVTEKLVLLVASEAVSLWYAVNTVLQMLRVFNNKGIPQSRVCST